MKYLSIPFFVLFCSACATTSQMNDLSIGMNKREVISVMGSPDSTKASHGIETLIYTLWDNSISYQRDYWVILKNGQVVEYGKASDLKSHKIQFEDVTNKKDE